MINSYGDYMIVGVIKAFWSNKGVTQPQVSPTALETEAEMLPFFVYTLPAENLNITGW